MAWTTLGTVAPGDVLRANSGTAAYNNVIGNLNQAPRGVLDKAVHEADQDGLTTATDMNLSVNWTAETGRVYKTTIYLPRVIQKANAGITRWAITDASNNTKQTAQVTGDVTWEFFVQMVVYETGLSGSVTRKGRFTSITNGNVDVKASSGSPKLIIVEDIGPA